MKLYVLRTGYLETDKNNVVACSTIGTRQQPVVESKWIKLPVMAFLIETDEGYILFDTGCHADAMNGHWPTWLQNVYPLHQTEKEKLENQIKLCGIAPTDIQTVVLSHLHMDHAGNIHQFTHADVYVPKEDFIEAQLNVRKCPDVNRHGAYIKSEMDVSVKEYHFVDEDFELAPGVEVIRLPGHTPGLLGLVVHLKGGTVILPQDCLYLQENYEPTPKGSGIMYDNMAYFKSIEKVRRLQKKYNARILYAHDYEFYKTVKCTPDYYE
ncbi:N-acyl homoserine lactonase family protein [Petralouisia muris]|uniref:N-acyl homoserine lactonase family protein n=1 Tax=Petralouisia muris TaxID=3032872 RepID=A0AC61RXG3_9FIRM|nr:N-acyl homoserine lactonase family protein [Petralouisia muris]TGY96437.1 N-acyl homoserine lactonase family protein [Petralouisia muris]